MDCCLSKKEVLRRAIERARSNGWWGGEAVLEVIERGLSFDVDIIVRGMCCTPDFAQAFWKDGNPEQHLLGMSLVESPLRYLEHFLEE
jgi:hypothetical protein